MRKYAPLLTALAAAAAPYRHRGRDRDYWNVEDPDRLYRAPPRGRARASGAKCNSGICGHGLGAFMAAMNCA